MFIGLDLGTSGLKALLCDETQAVRAVARVGYPMDTRSLGLVEQDCADWIRAVETAMADLRAADPAGMAAVRAIGLSGQMHTLVVLGADDAPLRPAMIWNDVRGVDFVRRAPEVLPDLAAITGVGPMTSFTAAKLDWLARHEPETFAAIRRIVLPKDFVRLWLTGDWATDASDAGGTQLFDQRNRVWSRRVCDHLGLDPAILPPVLEGVAVAGQLRADLAGRFGLPRVPVICGGADAATGALATACADPGRAVISLGTGSVYVTADSAYTPPVNPTIHHFAHCLPGRWYRMAAMLNCGSAFDWACGLVGTAPAEMLARIDAQGWDGPSMVSVLPFLDGVRTPHGDPRTRGAIFGLDRATAPIDLARAVIEGVCFTLADADAALRRSGPVAEVPTLIGGGARSTVWTRMLATVLGRPLAVAVGAEGGSALGAVRIAMLGTGATVGEVILPPPTVEVAPDPRLRAACDDRLAALRALYPAVAGYADGQV